VALVSWVVVYIAPSRSSAESVRALLQREGLLATIRPAGGMRGADEGSFEVLVPSSEARDATELLSRVTEA